LNKRNDDLQQHWEESYYHDKYLLTQVASLQYKMRCTQDRYQAAMKEQDQKCQPWEVEKMECERLH
jgi:hypothetical protein